MKDKLLNLLFPPKCMLCRQTLGANEAGICQACCQQVEWNLVPNRIGGEDSFDVAAAGFWYEGPVRQALHGLKYQEKQSYARPLAQVMAYVYQNSLKVPADLVTFVPTNRATRRSRGYNQAQLLAVQLAKLINLPCIEALEKVRETKTMHGLDAKQRRENVAGAYRLFCPAERVNGKVVLLIDDILTTGATLEACAKTLKSAGARQVVGLCAAAAGKTS